MPLPIKRRHLTIAISLLVLVTAVAVAWLVTKPERGKTSHTHSRVAGEPFFIKPATGATLIHGKERYVMFCASCHGAEGEGEPNWRQRMANGRLPAPPHDVSGHTWHHPDEQLVSMVRDGFVPGVTAPVGYESNMPAFGHVLSDAEIESILAYIKTFWPEAVVQAQREISLQ